MTAPLFYQEAFFLNTFDFHNMNLSTLGRAPAPKPQILLYHFSQDERTRQIRRYLRRAGVDVREVPASDLFHPLGYLFEIPGFSPCSRFPMGENFSEEMLVMKDFSNSQMDAFLQFFRDNQLKNVDLKAVLTPVTVHWNSMELYRELKKEHQELR